MIIAIALIIIAVVGGIAIYVLATRDLRARMQRLDSLPSGEAMGKALAVEIEAERPRGNRRP